MIYADGLQIDNMQKCWARTISLSGWCRPEAVVFRGTCHIVLILVRDSDCNFKNNNAYHYLLEIFPEEHKRYCIYCHLYLEISETHYHLLFSSSATAVKAAFTSMAETRSITHPANFLTGPKKKKFYNKILSLNVFQLSGSTHIPRPGTVFAGYSSHSHTSMTSLCVKCSLSAK